MNRVQLKKNERTITLLSSEIFDFIDNIEDLEIESIPELVIELEDILDDIIIVYDENLLAKGLKKRIAIFKNVIQFFQTIELRK